MLLAGSSLPCSPPTQASLAILAVLPPRCVDTSSCSHQAAGAAGSDSALIPPWCFVSNKHWSCCRRSCLGTSLGQGPDCSKGTRNSCPKSLVQPPLCFPPPPTVSIGYDVCRTHLFWFCAPHPRIYSHFCSTPTYTSPQVSEIVVAPERRGSWGGQRRHCLWAPWGRWGRGSRGSLMAFCWKLKPYPHSPVLSEVMGIRVAILSGVNSTCE